MRLFLRAAALMTFVFLLVSTGFANSPAKDEKDKKIELAAATATSDAGTADENSAALPAAPEPAPVPAAAPQGGMSAQPAPRVTPVLATTGTLGLFTLETADTLPKHGFAFSAYVNKFSRMPGSVSILGLGLNFNYGVTDWLSFYGVFQPYNHSHVGDNTQLSLAPPNDGFPQYPGSVFHTLGIGGAPGYVEDYPFVARNDGGVGEVTLGVKFGIVSQRRGSPVSVSFRNDIHIPTRMALADLLDNGTQLGRFGDTIAFAVSRQWNNAITATFNLGYRFTISPRHNNQELFSLANQLRAGVGFIVFPESRFQFMNEYSAVVFTDYGPSTQNTTFGARDPMDGIWGVRMYPWRNIAIDAGYRYMMNLQNAHDRHGFVVKLAATHWPERLPPPNQMPTASCAVDKNMVYVGSGDVVAVSGTASDSDGDPLTYTWSANGGQIDGSGPQVRWNSAGVAQGQRTITLRVDDGRGGTASCNSTVNVEARPNAMPTISCSVDRASVFAGENVRVTAVANDSDNDTLTYIWRANAGQVTGTGAAVNFSTAGLAPGNYTVTGRVEDGRGGAADCSTVVAVRAVPPPPQASKVNECLFGRAQSSRIDNVCKRILDDVALRLQSEPRSSVVIIGYSDPRETRADRVAGSRGTNAVAYLGEKGIDASRASTRTGSGQAGAGAQNRRVDIIFVPEGATY